MQSTNPISPARRSSFALALAVTFAPLIMGGEVALAKPQCEPPTGSECLQTYPTPSVAPAATFNITNKFTGNTHLYGAPVTDDHFWILVTKTGGGIWYFEDTNGCYWEFPQSGTCFVKFSTIQQVGGGRSINVAQGATDSAVLQAIYWPKDTAPTKAPSDAPPSGQPNQLPAANTGTYAAYAELELSVVPGGASVIDVTVLDRYNFAHQLVYWNSPNCAVPSHNAHPNIACGFNGKATSKEIYNDLASALGTTASGKYYPANYPDQSLMRLNGLSGDFGNAKYTSGQWFKCDNNGLLDWGLEDDYLTKGFGYNGGEGGYSNYAPLSAYGNVAQNIPIDTGSSTYSTDHCGMWHPSKSSVSKSTTGVYVAQAFGNKYGGESGYLAALYEAMPPGGYIISNSQRNQVDPGTYPVEKPLYGGSGYSFNLNIVQTNFGDEKTPLYDYHLELQNIKVFNTPSSGPGIVGDPTFNQTHSSGQGVWYPSQQCGSPLDYQMQNPPRGRFGVPSDPLTCLLVEGAAPNHLPSTTLSDKYDYPYVYTQIMVAPAGGPYGPAGGPLLKNPDDQWTLLTDDPTNGAFQCPNPNGTGRTFTPPGYQALRQYLLEQDPPIKEYVNNAVFSNLDTWNPTSDTPRQGTVLFEVVTNNPSCTYGGSCPSTGFCTDCPLIKPCPTGTGTPVSAAFCNYYFGNYSTFPTWAGAPTVGTGLKPDHDTFNAIGFPGWGAGGGVPSCTNSNLGGKPFNWVGPYYDAQSTIYPSFYICTSPGGCSCLNSPGSEDGIAAGWVQLNYYPYSLKPSVWWTWPPATAPLPPPETGGVLLKGTFNWDGSSSTTAENALIKIGTNGYPEAYFEDQPLLQWQSQVTNPSSYNSSSISWDALWTDHAGAYLLFPECGMPATGPTCAYNSWGTNTPNWGGGKIVPYIGNWTDMFVNMGGAPNKSLVMYSKNYPDGSPTPPPNAPLGGWGPCPGLVGSQGLYGFDPFVKAMGWPKASDVAGANLKACGVADPSLEGWFSQDLIAAMLADVSTIIQFGLLTDQWNNGFGFEYFQNAVGTQGLPFSSATFFKNPCSTCEIEAPGPYGNSFIKSLLENSLGYNQSQGGFPTHTKVIPAYASTYADRFKLVAPAFSFNPGNSYFQWNLGVPTISSVSDINGDGCVGSEDLTMLLAAWGACGKGKCPEDLNKDGIVEGGDLVHVLAEWGVGCGSP